MRSSFVVVVPSLFQGGRGKLSATKFDKLIAKGLPQANPVFTKTYKQVDFEAARCV